MFPSVCLQHLPPGRYLAGLQVLDLEGNRFSSVPPALTHARAVTHLDLSCNQELQISAGCVAVLQAMSALAILDVSKVSERLPHECPMASNEVRWLAAPVIHSKSGSCPRSVYVVP
jgi:hypothetical protein